MKHLLTVFLAAALALSLCCCDKAYNGSENSGESSSMQNGSSTEQTASVGDPVVNVNNPNMNLSLMRLEGIRIFDPYISECCATESGFYYFFRSGDTSKANFVHLMYVDYKTGQNVYVCTDSSCKHDSERCTSVFSTDEFFIGFSSDLFFYNGYLYLLSKAYDSNDGLGTTSSFHDPFEREQALYRINPDGSGRRKIYTFDKDISIEGYTVGAGDDLWFTVKTPDFKYDEKTEYYLHTSKNKCMIRLNLSQGEIVEQIPIYAVGGYVPKFFCCSSEKVIFRSQHYPDGITEHDIFLLQAEYHYMEGKDERKEFYAENIEPLEEASEYVYYTLDLVTKEMKEFFRTSEKFLDDFIVDDYVYFEDNHMPYNGKLDLITGEYSRFYPAEGYRAESFFAGRFVCRKLAAEPHAEGFLDLNDWCVYYIAPETGEISKSFDNLKRDNALYLIADADDKALVKYDEEKVQSADPRNGSETHYKYAMISYDDLFNGQENFEHIKGMG